MTLKFDAYACFDCFSFTFYVIDDTWTDKLPESSAQLLRLLDGKSDHCGVLSALQTFSPYV